MSVETLFWTASKMAVAEVHLVVLRSRYARPKLEPGDAGKDTGIDMAKRPAVSKVRKVQRVHEVQANGFPTADQVLEFIRNSEETVGKREIARAFGITGNGRVKLKLLLAELGREGKLAGNRREFREPRRATAGMHGRSCRSR